jgi:predicted GNAT family N-acyltransferase
MQIRVREAFWDHDKDILRKIRKIVFIEEQNVPIELEWDDRDVICWHVLVTLNDRPVATGRLDSDGKIGRMAVLHSQRGLGLGQKVLKQLLAIARREGIRQTYMHAQCHALPFYISNGFEAYGEIYDEAGIAHQNAREILGQ